MAAGDEDELAAAMAMSMGGAAEPSGATDEAASPAQEAVALLKANTPAVLSDTNAVHVLTTLLGNLVKSPGEEKFRRVKTGNAKIAKVLSCTGAEALLFAAGFQKQGEMLEVPGATSPSDLAAAAQEALDTLAAACGDFELAAQLRAGDAVRCVCGLPGGGLATGAMDNLIRVYQPGRWEDPSFLSGHEKRAGVNGVLALTAGGDDPSALTSAGRDGKILVWRGGQQQAALQGHGEGVEGTNVHVVCALARRADGALISGGWDKTARVWQGESQVAVLQGHEVAVNSVAGLPTGEVATGSGDKTIKVWRDGQMCGSLDAQAPVRSVSSCGGSLLVSGANDGLVRLWDLSTGQQLDAKPAASSYILSTAFRAGAGGEGEVAAGADDGTVAIFAVEGRRSLRQTQSLQLCGEVYGLTFLSSGDLAAACGDSSCTVFTRSPSRMAPVAVRQDYDARIAAVVAAKLATQGPSGGGDAAPAAGGGFDFSFPVDFGSRKMNIAWNRGEEPQVVADRFLRGNGLDASHTADVLNFIAQAQQQTRSGPGTAGGNAAGGAAPSGGSFDFSYPVEVADGRRLQIQWNRGDDPQQVAAQFAMRNGIGMQELPDILGFIQQVSGGPAVPMVQQAAPQVSPAVQQQALQQVMEMGFDEATARAALQATGWSVEAAIGRLFS